MCPGHRPRVPHSPIPATLGSQGKRSRPVESHKVRGQLERVPGPIPLLHQDRLFPSDPTPRRLYKPVRGLPTTDARWFAENQPFPDPTSLFIIPDHYVFRLLYSQGIAMENLGIAQKELSADEARQIWRRFADSY